MTPEQPLSQNDYADALSPPVVQPPQVTHLSPRPPSHPGKGEFGELPGLRLPGSKYFTLRYLLAAALTDGESLVIGPAISDDTAVLVRALRSLGARIAWERIGDDGEWALRVVGVAGRPQRPPDGRIQAGNAGAVLRLLLGIGALLPDVTFTTDHPDSLGRRPNADLLNALRSLGIAAEAREPGGLLPITLHGGPPQGGAVSVSGARSSQYLSALLYLGPLLQGGLTITVTEGLRSAPFVRATLRALAAAGITVEATDDLWRFVIHGRQGYQAGRYVIPADMPSAAALLCAALVIGRPLTLSNLDSDGEDTQALADALATLSPSLGAKLTERPTHGNGGAIGVVPAAHDDDDGAQGDICLINGDACIDSVPVLVAAACFAEGETRFEQVANLRLKESDRIEDLCTELQKAGADVTPYPDAIHVRGRPEGIAGGETVDGHDDHRLVQALAIAALHSEHGLTITNADAVAKSYPWFFDDLARLDGSLWYNAQ